MANKTSSMAVIQSTPAPLGQTSEKNSVQTTPHPPYGHLLPMPEEKVNKEEALWERSEGSPEI